MDKFFELYGSNILNLIMVVIAYYTLKRSLKKDKTEEDKQKQDAQERLIKAVIKEYGEVIKKEIQDANDKQMLAFQKRIDEHLSKSGELDLRIDDLEEKQTKCYADRQRETNAKFALIDKEIELEKVKKGYEDGKIWAELKHFGSDIAKRFEQLEKEFKLDIAQQSKMLDSKFNISIAAFKETADRIEKSVEQLTMSKGFK